MSESIEYICLVLVLLSSGKHFITIIIVEYRGTSYLFLPLFISFLIKIVYTRKTCNNLFLVHPYTIHISVYIFSRSFFIFTVHRGHVLKLFVQPAHSDLPPFEPGTVDHEAEGTLTTELLHLPLAQGVNLSIHLQYEYVS